MSEWRKGGAETSGERGKPSQPSCTRMAVVRVW